jgi:hypothetical protein
MADNTNIQKLNTLNGWAERVDSLKKYVDALGDTELSAFATSGFFCSEIKKAHSPATALGVLCHCSAGAVGDNFDGKTTLEDKMSTIEKIIAPALTAEQVKARNLETALAMVEKLQAKGFDNADITDIVKNLPEGKAALAQKGIK